MDIQFFEIQFFEIQFFEIQFFEIQFFEKKHEKPLKNNTFLKKSRGFQGHQCCQAPVLGRAPAAYPKILGSC